MLKRGARACASCAAERAVDVPPDAAAVDQTGAATPSPRLPRGARGGDAACAGRRCARRRVDVPAATVAAVDQTGAGDAFAAGYLAALVQGQDDVACARAAVRAATEAVSRPGARPR